MSESKHPMDASTERGHTIPDRALSALDAAQAGAHVHDRDVTRAAPFVKDDRRSSARLTEREASERWPLG